MRALYPLIICILLYSCYEPKKSVQVEVPEDVTVNEIGDTCLLIQPGDDSIRVVLNGKGSSFATGEELKPYLQKNLSAIKGCKVAIRAPTKVSYAKVKAAIEVLRDSSLRINTFSLITGMDSTTIPKKQ